MGLKRDGCNKILDSDGQGGGIEGCVVLDGPQGGTEAAEKSRGLDGCKDFLLDGPQRGRSTRCPDKATETSSRQMGQFRVHNPGS